MDFYDHKAVHDGLDGFVARIANSVRPLYVVTHPTVPRHIGCCVLFRLGSHRFLLTAGHVIAEFLSSEMFLAADTQLIQVKGKGTRAFLASSKSIELDLLDIGVLCLDDTCGVELDANFLTLADLNIRDWMNPSSNYLLFGYPANSTRIDSALRRVQRGPFRFVGSVTSHASHRSYGITRQSHVALDFDIERIETDEGIRTGPSPKGVSGGGMWCLPQLDDPAQVGCEKLSAIFVAYSKRHKLLVGTRIGAHTELIRERWPETGATIPKYGGPPMQFRTASEGHPSAG